jgi:hypothetical protein
MSCSAVVSADAGWARSGRIVERLLNRTLSSFLFSFSFPLFSLHALSQTQRNYLGIGGFA